MSLPQKLPEGWKRKPLDEVTEEVTEDEYIRVSVEKIRCGNCSNCLCSYENWEGARDCNDVKISLDLIAEGKGFKERAERIAEALTIFDLDMIRRLIDYEEAPVLEQDAPADMLPFKQTIDLMKSRGYRRCYMCGGSLERKED